jgi:hypothetical protein
MVVSIPSPRAPPPARHVAAADGRVDRTPRAARRDRSTPAPFYLPRRPRDSPLFQLLERHFAEFERVYAERFAPSFGHWRPIVAGTVAKFLRCGDLHEGFARVKCRACKHEFFVAFSCKQRCVCASCHQPRKLSGPEAVADPLGAARGGSLRGCRNRIMFTESSARNDFVSMIL